MSVNPFGEYESQSTRGLAQINSTKYPDTNKDFEANVVRLNQFVDYISSYLQTMQKGVDKANQDVIGKLRDFSADMSVLFGGGQLLYGTDLGDMQYFLPALGAIFGFDADTPFPINLFNAVEQLFLGYIVPQDAWAAAVNDQVFQWAEAANLDPDFVQSLHELIDAFGGVTDEWNDFLQSINDLLSIIFTNPNQPDLSAFADLWNAISELFGGFGIDGLGSVLNPTLHSLAPWIHDLADGISKLSAIIKSWSQGVDDLQGILNFSTLFGWINFTPDTDFDPVAAWDAMIAAIFGNSQQFVTTVQGIQIPLGNLINTNIDLQGDSSFNSAGSVAAAGGWSHDAGVGRLAPGSLKGVANGTFQAVHGEWANVVTGDVVNPQCYVLWSGLSGTGDTMKLQIATDKGTYTDIAKITNPPANGTWAHLIGSYTVPPGVTKVKMRLVITAAALGGFVWWDDAPDYKDQAYLPQAWIDQLTPMWNQLLSWFNYTPAELVTTNQSANDFWTDVINFFINPTALLAPTSTTNTLASVNNQFADIVNNVIVTPINQAVADFSTWWNGLFGPPQQATNHTSFVTAVAAGASGQIPSGSTQEAVAGAAVASITQTINDLTSTVQGIQAIGDQNIGGNIIDDFGGGTASGWGSNWSTSGGTPVRNKGFYNSAGTVKGLYIADVLNTDNQVVAIVLNSLPTMPWGGGNGSSGRNRIKGRYSADGQYGVYADVWSNGVRFGYTTGGTDVPVGSFVPVAIQSAASIELRLGTGIAGQERRFQITQNSKTVIASWDDTSAALTRFGAAYRVPGQDQAYNGSYAPGNTRFHAQDVVKPLYKGIMGRQRNKSNTAIQYLSSGGTYKVPYGWFDYQDYITPGVSLIPSGAGSSAGYVVLDEGEYEFEFSVAVQSGVLGSSNNNFIAAGVIGVNDAPISEGESVYAYGTGVGPLSIYRKETVYLMAGDKIFPAIDCRVGQWGIMSDPNGFSSWMRISKKAKTTA